MDKLIRNGQVAVLYSPGFGAGWSTWNTDHASLLFDPEIVLMVEQGRQDEIEAYCDAKYGEDEIYCGGAHDLRVAWLPAGTLFKVDEYDGSESISVQGDINWYVA